MKNLPLKTVDQAKLKTLITDHVSMMLCGNFDRWFPGENMEQITSNVHMARTAGATIAEHVLKMISNKGPAGLRCEPTRLRDLAALMSNAAAQAKMSVSAPGGRKNVSMSHNSSFISAIAGCAYRVLVDLIIEDAQ